MWELILVLVARPFEPHSIAFVRVAVVLSSICMLGAVLVAARLARVWLGADAAAMTLVLLAGSMGLARFPSAP